jgi:hypothetical protein
MTTSPSVPSSSRLSRLCFLLHDPGRSDAVPAIEQTLSQPAPERARASGDENDS